MAGGYNFNGSLIAQQQGRWNPQNSHMGMIEFQINGTLAQIAAGVGVSLTAGGVSVSGGFEVGVTTAVPESDPKQVLIVSLRKFTMPNRSFGKDTIPYLNSHITYNTQPGPLDNLVCDFGDYLDSGTRRVLEAWARRIYDERTGLGGLPTDFKTSANVLMFGQDGSHVREYELVGIWPLYRPGVMMDFAGGGAMNPMTMDFAVDYVLDTRL